MGAGPGRPGGRAMTEPLLRVKGLVKNFALGGGFLGRNAETVHAVDQVSFEIGAGETLGLVGESGSGKSTTGRCILRLIEPTAGEVWFEGRNVTALDIAEFRSLCRDMQIIFQDPFAPLNPRVRGRPAPPHRHWACGCGRAEADGVRRAGLRARRLDPGASDQPARRP